MLRQAFDWTFRSREDGRIVVAQVPNVALGVFLVAATIDRLLEPGGRAGTAVDVLSAGGLTWWAGDEVLRGVNPFRRGLGAVVLVALALRLG